jgi:hypothetical protein
MKTDAYTKTMLTVIVVCLIIICVLQVKRVQATGGALAFAGSGSGIRPEGVMQIESRGKSSALPQRPIIKIRIRKESE